MQGTEGCPRRLDGCRPESPRGEAGGSLVLDRKAWNAGLPGSGLASGVWGATRRCKAGEWPGFLVLWLACGRSGVLGKQQEQGRGPWAELGALMGLHAARSGQEWLSKLGAGGPKSLHV